MNLKFYLWLLIQFSSSCLPSLQVQLRPEHGGLRQRGECGPAADRRKWCGDFCGRSPAQQPCPQARHDRGGSDSTGQISESFLGVGVLGNSTSWLPSANTLCSTVTQVNGVDFSHFTREEAAMFLMNIRSGEHIDLVTQNKMDRKYIMYSCARRKNLN